MVSLFLVINWLGHACFSCNLYHFIHVLAIPFLLLCDACNDTHLFYRRSGVQCWLVRLSNWISKVYDFDNSSFTRSHLFRWIEFGSLHFGDIWKSKFTFDWFCIFYYFELILFIIFCIFSAIQNSVFLLHSLSEFISSLICIIWVWFDEVKSNFSVNLNTHTHTRNYNDILFKKYSTFLAIKNNWHFNQNEFIVFSPWIQTINWFNELFKHS